MILFFDTETNGLPAIWKAPPSADNNWPRIVQLAFSTYSLSGELIGEFDYIIRPDGWEIDNESQATLTHGITQEIALEQGVPLLEAMEVFLNELANCTYLVAHNLEFDYKVTISEYMRLRAAKELDAMPRLTLTKICTMKESTDLCAIPGGYGRKKWPRLEELHQHLFQCDFEGAHNALFDIRATAKCFFELTKRKVISLQPSML